MIVMMILPDKKMKRYAQFSLSIIFLFYFIQPIVQLFNMNIQTDASKLIDSLFSQNGSENIEQTINLQKKDIQASTHAYVIEELGNQVKTELEDEFASLYGFRITQITFDHVSDELSTELANVSVYVEEETFNNIHIKPVWINTEEPGNESTYFHENYQAMQQWLSQALEMEHEQLTIYWEGG